MSFAELSRLTGEPIREVCFAPPAGSWRFLSKFPLCRGCSEATHVLKLIKGVYGLKDAPRAWRIKLDQVLRALGGHPLAVDPCVYIWFDGKRLTMALSAHVDDLKGCGMSEVVKQVLAGIEKAVGKLKMHFKDFEHCGIMHRSETTGERRGVYLSQDHYIRQLRIIEIDKSVRPESLCSSAHAAAFGSLLGGIGWLINTRLDIAVYTSALQRVAKEPKYVDLLKLNQLLRWLRRTPIETYFGPLKPPYRICAVSDSAFKRQDDSGLACRGSILTLGEYRTDEHPGGLVHLLDWQSRRQRRVTRSTFGAELNGLVDTVELGKLIAMGLSELAMGPRTATQLAEIEEFGRFPIPIDAVIDAKAVYEAVRASDPKVPAEASLMAILLVMRENLANGRVRRLYWVDTRDMLADGMNKGSVPRTAICDAMRHGLWTLKYTAVSFSAARRTST
jgi:hypothetical protein